MTVYVDAITEYAAEPAGYVGRPRTRPRWSHMTADGLGELHLMAERLGLRREWFQGDHYDVVPAKRRVAIRAGARELGRRDFVAKLHAFRAYIEVSRARTRAELAAFDAEMASVTDADRLVQRQGPACGA